MQTGGHTTNSHPYRKLESVQEASIKHGVLGLGKDRKDSLAGRHRGRRWACSIQAGMETKVAERTKKQTGRHANRFVSL